MANYFLLTFDDNYLTPAIATMRSLAFHMPGANVIAVVKGDHGDDVRRGLAAYDVTLTVVPMRTTYVDWPTTRVYISDATFARLDVDHYVPADAERVVYLDVDTLVVGDLTPLLEVDLTGLYAAVVEVEPRYFNAGMVALNMTMVRRIDWPALIAAATSGQRLSDQDLLNAAFAGKVRWMSCVYNFMINGPMYWGRSVREIYDDGGHGELGIRLLHYIGPHKPWNADVNGKMIYEMYDKAVVPEDVDINVEQNLLRVYIPKAYGMTNLRGLKG